jgi:PhnB protein
MADDALIDRLNGTIDAILARRDATAALRDPELAPLARVAADLRHYPGAPFKARLRAELKRRTAMSAALVTTRIREGFTTVTPYVRVRDAGLVDFLARAFGAEETFSGRGSGGGMHREVRVGNSMLMIGEGGDEGGVMPIRPSEFHVFVADVDAAFRRAIDAGATSLGEPEDREYGERSGFVKDPFGNYWYIATALDGPPVPEGHRTITPTLHPKGAPEYIDFLKRAFGAIEESRHAGPEGSVVHALVRIGDAAIELGEAGYVQPMPSAFFLYVGNADLLYDQALAAGAASLWPPADQPYGDRVGGVADAMGNQWFIAQARSS